MAQVSIRDLRNRGGDIVSRAANGERIIITRNGQPVAELSPIRQRWITAEALIEHSRHLRPMDPVQFRKDLDELIDPRL